MYNVVHTMYERERERHWTYNVCTMYVQCMYVRTIHIVHLIHFLMDEMHYFVSFHAIYVIHVCVHNKLIESIRYEIEYVAIGYRVLAMNRWITSYVRTYITLIGWCAMKWYKVFYNMLSYAFDELHVVWCAKYYRYYDWPYVTQTYTLQHGYDWPYVTQTYTLQHGYDWPYVTQT